MHTTLCGDSAKDVRVRLAAVVGRYLPIDLQAVDPAAPLARYGLDSLMTMEVLAALEEEFGRPLDGAFLEERPTLRTLEAWLAGEHGAGSCSEEEELALIAADSQLPPGLTIAAGDPRTPPQSILVTGATGFLGAFLLRRLIDDTDAGIWCLVRPGRDVAGARLEANLRRYNVWTHRVPHRVRVVTGDVSAPALGLPAPVFDDLAGGVDAVYHAAADVNWTLQYRELREANVLGTLNVLRLACAGRPKMFHLVSSLSVCFAAAQTEPVSEGTDMLGRAGRLTLGYARSKCAAESLVRQAAARGLRACIHRPGLIAGDAVTGTTNLGDIMAALVKGCVQMGAAPDLDWELDAPAADDVARAIVHGPDPDASGLQTLHLVQRRPRSWRECVLWMNLRGYRCELVPYAEWRARLDAASRRPGHALWPLRRFFLETTAAGVTSAEVFQRGGHAPVDSRTSLATLEAKGLGSAPMGAAQLNRYFDDYVRRGFLPPASPRRPGPGRQAGGAWWERPETLTSVMRARLGDSSLRVMRVEPLRAGSEHSVIAELTSWRHGSSSGLFRCRIEVEQQDARRRFDVMIKSKPEDEDGLEVAETMADLGGPALGQALRSCRELIGLRAAHLRELAIYGLPAAGLVRHMPGCFGVWRDDERREWGLVLECLDSVELMDSADAPERWDPARIDAALEGLAGIHASFLGEAASLASMPWIGHVRSAAAVRRMTGLWAALADAAANRFEAWAGADLRRRHHELASDAGDWWSALEASPSTLIHHDFNPRNIALRREGPCAWGLCAYDWELATLGAPQRDLAEFLSFVLEPDAAPRVAGAWVERYRRMLESASGRPLDEWAWRAGFSAAMAEFLVDRLGFYAMIDRVRPQAFLPRVVRAWAAIDACTRREG